MNAEDRGIWTAQAWAVVGDIPALAFSIACDEARRVVDHPSKIVPAIVRFSEPLASNIRRRYESELRLWENRNAPRLNRDPAAARRERQEVGALVSNLVRQMQRKAANHG